jgi:hypothetical protein
MLCRVYKSLPSALFRALSKEPLCRVLHSAKQNTRQNKTLGKETLCRVSGTQQRKTLGKQNICRVLFFGTRQNIFIFFSFLLSNFFCCDVTLSLTTYANLAHYSNCLLVFSQLISFDWISCDNWNMNCKSWEEWKKNEWKNDILVIEPTLTPYPRED